MDKKLLLPFSFFLDVMRLLFILEFYYVLDDETEKLCSSLDSQLSAKLAALDRHDSFSKYKSAHPGSPERDRLRREYLDKAGIHKDWRANEEFPF